MSTQAKPVAASSDATDKRTRRRRKAKEKPAYAEVVNPATGSPTIKFTAAPNPSGK